MAPKATKAKKERGSTTPAERAQEALDRANRVVTRIEGRITQAKQVVTDLEAELKEAQARRDYAALNPALPAQSDAADNAESEDGTGS